MRRSDDFDLKAGDRVSGAKDETEVIDNVELRYEYLYGDSILAAFSGYYNRHDVVSFDGGTTRTNDIGELQTFGLELELAYRTKTTDISFSHNFTKLIDFDLRRDTTAQNLTAEPYGYGRDLANWSNYSTKLSFSQKLAKRWSASGSVRVYWGYPGGQDLANYHERGLGGTNIFLPLYDDGVDSAFDPSVFLNLGVEYEPIEKLVVGLHTYNVLRAFDGDLNKRNHFQRTTEYREEAASIALSLRYEVW